MARLREAGGRSTRPGPGAGASGTRPGPGVPGPAPAQVAAPCRALSQFVHIGLLSMFSRIVAFVRNGAWS
jgi:hypothetical protein